MGIALHLDGARLWNAHIATGISLHEYGKYFDTVSVCLSKGLGAPIGSVLLSTKEKIVSARQWRKRYGGGMRQVGILAAAAHYALDTNLPLLADDHRRAHAISLACQKVSPSIVNAEHVKTNIVALDLNPTTLTGAQLAEKLREQGILSSALGPKFLRLVTHLDFNDEQLEVVLNVLPKVLQSSLKS